MNYGIVSITLMVISFAIIVWFSIFLINLNKKDDFWVKHQECFNLGKRIEFTKDNKVECK